MNEYKQVRTWVKWIKNKHAGKMATDERKNVNKCVDKIDTEI